MAKLWERPWTSEEMKENASNWNLAGDAGLLKHLQQFSQSLIGRIHTTNSAMDDMFRKLNNVATEINNVNNTFLSLANTQFVENRVYEDEDKDSPNADIEQMTQPKSKEALETEMIQRVKKSLEIGFAVMDTKFNAIEVSGSDSEDEGSPSSVIRTVLEPKNPYLYQPLPHLIGSTEFMGDDSVGLVTANEDIMTPPLTTHSSTSDLNEDLVEESRDSVVKQASDWLSENEDVDMFGRDSSPEELDFDAPNSQQAKSAASFAEELSSKLGGVASAGMDKKPADLRNEPTKANVASNDSIISIKNTPPTGIPSLFGPSNNLFHDDDDDEDIFTPKNKNTPQVSALFDEHNTSSQRKESNSPKEKVNNILQVPNSALLQGARKSSTPNYDGAENFPSPANISKILVRSGLFDDDNQDDDDLFTVSTSKSKQDISKNQTNEASSNITVAFSESSSIPIENELNIPIVRSSSSGLYSFGDTSNIPGAQENLSESVDKSTKAASASASGTSEGWLGHLLDEDVRNSKGLFDEDVTNDSLFRPTQRAAAESQPSATVNKRPLSLFENDGQSFADTRSPTEGKTSEKSLFDDEDLFSQSSHEPNYDIFGSNQGKMNSDDLFSFQPSNVSASDIFDTGSDETDDIFSVVQSGSTFNENVEDFISSSSPSQKSQSSEPKINPPTTLSKQNADLFSVPQIGSILNEDIEDLFSFSPNQKLQTSEQKINSPTTLRKQNSDLFLDSDDADMDLFGVTNNVLRKNTGSLFQEAPTEENEKESNPPHGQVRGNQEKFSETLESRGEKPSSKPNVIDKDKQSGMFKDPQPDPRKVKLNEPLSATVAVDVAKTQEKPWTKDKVIGKIKSPIGFVVDPLALLPGSKPPPREKMAANDLGSQTGFSGDHHASKIDVGKTTKEKASPEAVTTASPVSSGFDDTNVAPTLHSAVKERAKIPVKRRPQSRRARHEAIRSSALFADDDLVATPPTEEPSLFAKVNFQEKPKIAASDAPARSATALIDSAGKESLTAQDIASPSTDEEDLFGVPQVIYKDKGDVEDQLFGSATVLSPYGEKDMGIFPDVENGTNSRSPPQPEVPKSKVENLPRTSSSVDILTSDPFSSDENIFSSSTSESKGGLFLGAGSSKTVSKKTSFSMPKATSKSLFDDDDDDDIFSKPPITPVPIAAKSAEVVKTKAIPPVVKASLRKTEDPFKDPLTSLPQD